MGGHLSTVLPRGMRGTSRRASPTRSEQLSKDESSLGLPNDKVNTRLQNDEDTIRVTKDEGNTNLPKDEDTPRLPKDAGANSTHLSKDDDNARLPGHADNKPEVAVGKRRALLVGICYNSPSNMWDALDRPHGDVERYRILLTTTYGYSPENIVVLKDLPQLPESSQPTRDNMIRELQALVSGAASGDRFTFFYSGHSDLKAVDDEEDEEGRDEMIITSDEKPIINDELKEMLVDPLPVGSSLLAILDTCHSGTLLHLPHYHCNDVYVPWQSKDRSKGNRRTMTKQIKMRGQATDIFSSVPPPSIETVIEAKAGQRFVCDGWCNYNEVPHPNVLSLSACSDLQRAWEGPEGSLTTVLCSYLETDSKPSYDALMAHINFQLHDNANTVHMYTLQERKMATRGFGPGFNGELDDFQKPELSSLVRLNMADILQL